jgi:N-acetyl-anhydromuramoyl-L-alanine amidase
MIRRGFDVVLKAMAVQPSAQSVRIDANTGLALGVRQVLTDHYDARPAGVVPDLVIVHGISLPPAQFGGPWIDRLFTGSLPGEVHPFFAAMAVGRVSAHALIRRDGEIVQYVPFAERAWHAGRSEYQGRAACNDFSVGIELEGTDDTAYEAVQYESLSALIRALLAAYPTLSRERVVGHSDVAPGRKSDPGDSFDWAKLRAAI